MQGIIERKRKSILFDLQQVSKRVAIIHIYFASITASAARLEKDANCIAKQLAPSENSRSLGVCVLFAAHAMELRHLVS